MLEGGELVVVGGVAPGIPRLRAVSIASCDPCARTGPKRPRFAEAAQRQPPRHRARLAERAGAAMSRPNDVMRDSVQLEQLQGLREVARRHLDLVAVLLEQPQQRPEEEDVRRVGDVDPDPHRSETIRSVWTRVNWPLSAPSSSGAASRRRPSGSASRSRGLAAGACAREAARDATARPLGRRVEPTEAGLRLYRGAQRLLTLEGQILDEIAGEGEGDHPASCRSALRPAPPRSSSRSCSASSSASIRRCGSR